MTSKACECEADCAANAERTFCYRCKLPMAARTQTVDAVIEARKALRCLYLAAEESVAEDVGKKVEAAFAQLSEPHCCRCNPVQHCTACPIPATAPAGGKKDG